MSRGAARRAGPVKPAPKALLGRSHPSRAARLPVASRRHAAHRPPARTATTVTDNSHENRPATESPAVRRPDLRRSKSSLRLLGTPQKSCLRRSEPLRNRPTTGSAPASGATAREPPRATCRRSGQGGPALRPSKSPGQPAAPTATTTTASWVCRSRRRKPSRRPPRPRSDHEHATAVRPPRIAQRRRGPVAVVATTSLS